MTKEELESIQREYNQAQGVEINNTDVELMPLPKPVVETVLETVEF